MRDPALIVALANARAVRRPTGAPARELHDALADAAHASEMLSPFLGRPVAARELPALRELHRAVVLIVDALIDGVPVPLERLNRIAARHPVARVLERQRDGALRATRRFGRAAASAVLTQRGIDELDGLDPLRLRRCRRPECRLVFYDRSRSGTQRWHHEHPCGLRERQRRYRAKANLPAKGLAPRSNLRRR